MWSKGGRLSDLWDNSSEKSTPFLGSHVQWRHQASRSELVSVCIQVCICTLWGRGEGSKIGAVTGLGMKTVATEYWAWKTGEKWTVFILFRVGSITIGCFWSHLTSSAERSRADGNVRLMMPLTYVNPIWKPFIKAIWVHLGCKKNYRKVKSACVLQRLSLPTQTEWGSNIL